MQKGVVINFEKFHRIRNDQADFIGKKPRFYTTSEWWVWHHRSSTACWYRHTPRGWPLGVIKITRRITKWFFVGGRVTPFVQVPCTGGEVVRFLYWASLVCQWRCSASLLQGFPQLLHQRYFSSTWHQEDKQSDVQLDFPSSHFALSFFASRIYK